MKKERMKGFACGVMVAVLVLGLAGTAVASVSQKSVTAHYRDIKITLNGATITPTDAHGNPVEPFLINGTTYLPVRGVASALGMDVSWDGETSTVILSDEAETLRTRYADRLVAICAFHEMGVAAELAIDKIDLIENNVHRCVYDDTISMAEAIIGIEDAASEFEDIFETFSAERNLMNELDVSYMAAEVKMAKDIFTQAQKAFSEMRTLKESAIAFVRNQNETTLNDLLLDYELAYRYLIDARADSESAFSEAFDAFCQDLTSGLT